MKQIKWLFVAVFALSSAVFAQDKLLTIDDIYSLDTSVRVNFSGTPFRGEWSADGRSFKQMQNGKLMRVNALTGTTVPYIDQMRFITAMARAGAAGARDAQRLADSMSLHFNKSETAILLSQKNDLWYYDIPSGIVRRLTNNMEEELEADFSPDGRWVSFVRGNNLFVVDAAKGGEK